jgi:hypothetical protein
MTGGRFGLGGSSRRGIVTALWSKEEEEEEEGEVRDESPRWMPLDREAN